MSWITVVLIVGAVWLAGSLMLAGYLCVCFIMWRAREYQCRRDLISQSGPYDTKRLSLHRSIDERAEEIEDESSL